MEVSRPLSAEEMRILQEAVAQHKPGAFQLLQLLGKTPLTGEQLELLRSALATELTLTGFTDEWCNKANERGDLIEGIIDALWYHSEDGLAPQVPIARPVPTWRWKSAAGEAAQGRYLKTEL